MSELTTNPEDPRLTHGADSTPSPQAKVYLVLSEEERAKGFVRPYRDQYVHVGELPRFPLRPLTDEEKSRFQQFDYVMYEAYPESESPQTGRYWTQAQLDSGCGATTTMSRELSETWARDPSFYGATYCVGCKMHRPVAEFIWKDGGQRLGS